ncbi:phenylacetate--CoA ligase family protein [Pseudonocardia humida]|uniref:Phenylacetate--CoA ligase family protein n=1 Tax=Pseudonocardia humida TaxID=2800819 RepID=A0ABT1ADN6_9PSEU|nr:phenylacetate--CoA ligase family protein [Pseudonocardia humida]MCO1661011.1 phenylacetate--CoA ligase family protein [Pseudonocardia humida]
MAEPPRGRAPKTPGNGSLWWLLRDLRRARRGGPSAVAARQRARLADLVAAARAGSPFYRELYRDLPDGVDDPRALPVTDKIALMARFDDWSTDRAVTLAGVRAFVERSDTIGTPFLGRHFIVTTSGTSGVRGVFVQDERMVRVLTAITVGRSTGQFLRGPRDYARLLRNGGRTAALWATDGHYAGYATARRLLAERPARRRSIRIVSVHRPLDEIVAELQRFRPAIVNGYASAVAMVAAEQAAGRLRIDPVLVVTAAEGLPPQAHRRIADAFGAKVRDQYGCSEFMGLATGCAHGWLHVNADWAILEPVDADGAPTPLGEPSHTVLLTNLANRVQPIIRYDLGDSVTQRPDPCSCGNPLPAVRVRGRTADVLTFGPPEHPVRIPPLALGTAVDRLPGVRRFQLVRPDPTTLLVRLDVEPGADPGRVRADVRAGLAGVLTAHGVPGVALVDDEQPPQLTPGGKLRAVYAAG